MRASVGHDTYSARQMVEHDHANVLAVGDLFEPDAEAASQVIEQIEGAGVGVAALGDRLQQDGGGLVHRRVG